MEISTRKGHLVWRVGRFPDPWAWAEHQYSGRNRWNDAEGNFRTIYASDSLYGCFVELLAFARPDLNDDGSDLRDGIDEDAADSTAFPTKLAGELPAEWVGARMQARGELIGEFADVSASSTIAELRPAFLRLAKKLGFPDFDAAALKLAHPRELTQRVATRLYATTDSEGEHPLDGVRFASRHGDDLVMWAIFERPDLDGDSSRLINARKSASIELNNPDMMKAMDLHGLTNG